MEPKDRVSGPATALMVVAIIGALVQLASLALNLLGVGLNAVSSGSQSYMNMLSGGIGIVFNVIGLAVAGFLFMGAGKMKRLESFTLSLVASIVAMVPCVSPCCFIGLPVGIWALVVIMAPEVKAAFADQQDTGGSIQPPPPPPVQ